MSGANPEVRLDAWKAFLRVHACVTGILAQELERDQQLPLTWYDVLVQLNAHGGRLRMHDLARAVLLSRAGLTRLVDRMAAAGLVDRVPCHDDRRGTFVDLTQRGAETLERAAPGHIDGIVRHFTAHMTDEEAETIARAFARIESAVDGTAVS